MGEKSKKKSSMDKKAALIRERIHENDRIMHLFYDNVFFATEFEKLSEAEQIQAYRVLKKLADDKKLLKCDGGVELVEDCLYQLNKINYRAGLRLNEVQHYPLSKDELHIIRMDFYGKVDVRPAHQLSNFYRKVISSPLPDQVDKASYDFDTAPCWQLFRQFKSFRDIEQHLKDYLHTHKINPDILKVMGVKDFSDLIFKTFQKSPDQLKVSFVDGDCRRNAFVKALAHKKGKEIERMLLDDNLDERYVKSLLNSMKKYGLTDTSKMVITETHYTQAIAENFAKAGWTFPGKIGDPLPQELVDVLIDNELGSLIQALDEKGRPLKKDGLPSFEVHHDCALTEGNSQANLASLNYFNNYTLVPSDLHHFVLHGYDKLTVADGKEAYRCRLEFVEPHVTFMYGLAKNKQLVYDWSNTPYMQKADEEDCKYHVKYDDIMAELLENRTKYASLIVKERKSETIDISRLKKLKGKDILELIESKRRHRK